MARDVIIHQINDWSMLNNRDDIWSKIDLSTPEINFGIQEWTLPAVSREGTYCGSNIAIWYGAVAYVGNGND